MQQKFELSTLPLLLLNASASGPKNHKMQRIPVELMKWEVYMSKPNDKFLWKVGENCQTKQL